MESVMLVSMHQLAEAHCDDDDWTGLKDQAERRKRQTRLSLRAYRKRKAAEGREKPETGLNSALDLRAKRAPEPRSAVLPGRPSDTLLPASNIVIPPGVTISGKSIHMRYLYPMSRDHLLPLVEFNIWRASLTNIFIIGHLHLLGSRSCRYGGHTPVFPSPYDGDTIPESLMPTPLQRRTPHADWIDLFPSPRMRDNAIRTQHLISNLELCADLMGGLSGQQNDVNSGLLVWSNPWEPGGWELTQGFIRKWGFLVEGCSDLLQSTNQWRDLRGEKPLIWEVE
ncbi:hypothetical protein BJ170DRAFT_70653 [Xylariales sp. AK1849]|nr:hypothetical protein BJ170DRAFT_70653 [Xylariales sp. AK1849]